MIIYRYEYPNGDGPFFTKDGHNHYNPNDICNDDTLSGCSDINTLNNWFSIRDINTGNFVIRKYMGDPIYKLQSGEIIITKSTAQRIDF